MEARIAALESDTAARLAKAEAAVAAADEKLGAVEADLAARIAQNHAAQSAVEGSDVASIMARLADTEVSITSFRQELKTLSGAGPIEAGTLSDAAVGGLRAEMSALHQRAESAVDNRVSPLEKEVADLEARLAAAEAAVSTGAASGKGAASAAAFAALSTAVNSASPYESELKTFTSVSGAAAPEARPVAAATGAPSLASLTATFSYAAADAISAATLAAAGESYSDQALAWVKSQVAIRPSHEEEGATPAAILSRAEARLNEGALKAALAELEALPTVSKEAMADWTARAEKRAAVDAALSELAASMLPGAAASN